MAYTLTKVKGVWYINGSPLYIPHSQETVNLPPITAIDDSGLIVPVAVDSTGALKVSSVSADTELILQVLLSRPPDAIDVRGSGVTEQTYSG